jgi:hypothetical protein
VTGFTFFKNAVIIGIGEFPSTLYGLHGTNQPRDSSAPSPSYGLPDVCYFPK